jgi:hypothetical protein
MLPKKTIVSRELKESLPKMKLKVSMDSIFKDFSKASTELNKITTNSSDEELLTIFNSFANKLASLNTKVDKLNKRLNP